MFATKSSVAPAASTAHEDGRSALIVLADLFSPRALCQPTAAVALHCGGQRGTNTTSVFSNADSAVEVENDAVIQTLRSAPLSLFREATAASTAFLPPPLSVASKQRSSSSSSSSRGASSDRDVSASNSHTDARVAVTRVLGVLSCVLQRSPAALGTSGNYAKLLRLLNDHDFTARAAHDMKVLWKECTTGASEASTDSAMDAYVTLSLYSDVLLLLSFHSAHVSETEAALSAGAALPTSSSGSGTASAGKTQPPALASAETLTSLYALNTEMGDRLETSAAPPSLLRRSLASLTAFLIHCAPQLSDEVLSSSLRDLERGPAARANLAHLAFVAALPSACLAKSHDWQCRALDVVRQATLYDADVHAAYSTDGPASVLLQAVRSRFGAALHGLLSIMSEAAWCFCTADALVHLCHAVGAYGGTWATYPISYVHLVNFLHRALTRYRSTFEKEAWPQLNARTSGQANAALLASPQPSDGLASAVVQANQRITGHRRLVGNSTIESLVSGAVLGTSAAASEAPRDAALRDDQQRSSSLTFPEDADCQGEREQENGGAAFLARCEADTQSPRSFLFYLSLLAYVTAALPPLLASFDELPLFFALTAAETSTRASITESTEAAANTESGAAKPAAPELSLFALCVELLQTNLSAAVGPHYDAISREDKQRRLLCEAAVCLVSAFLCEFPHSIQRLEEATGSRQLVRTVSLILPTIFAAPRASFQMRRAANALLRRYHSALNTSISAVVAHLMAPANWAALSGNAEYVQATFAASNFLYRFLCHDNEMVEEKQLSCAMDVLAEMPAGAFRCVAGGAAVAAVAVNTVFRLREVAVADNALFASVTVAQLPQLLSRLAEAVDALVHAELRCGWAMATADSTRQSACVAVWLLHKTTSLYRASAAMAAATFPVPCAPRECSLGGSGDGNRRQRSVVELCLRVLCSERYKLAHREVADLLVSAMRVCAEEHNDQQVFQVLRSTLTDAEVADLRETLLAVQKGAIGTYENVLRLEVWLAMVRWCPALFVLLFGPPKQNDDDDDAASVNVSAKDAKAKGSAATEDLQPDHLPFAKLLVATVRAKEAAPQEKALSLQILRHAGLTSALEVKDVASMLLREGGTPEAPAVNGASDARSRAEPKEWELVMLASASVAYVNAAIAAAIVKAKGKGAEGADAMAGGGSRGGGGPHTVERTPPFGSAGSSRTPLHRPQLQPLATPLETGASAASAMRCKVLRNFTDDMDQLLRYIPTLQDRCRAAYERESREVSYEDVFEWTARHAADLSVYGGMDGLSVSVVLPRQGQESWSSTNSGAMSSTTMHNSSALVRHPTPTALATAVSRASGSQVATHLTTTTTATSPLLFLSSAQAALLLPFHRLAPIGPAEARFFRGTDDDARLNTLATLLEEMTGLASAAEQLLWFSGADSNAAALFNKRTQALLLCAIQGVVSSRPSAPLLAQLLTRHVQQQLRLSRAAASILENSLNSDTMELDVTPSIQRALLRLVSFIKVNRRHTFLFVDAVPVITAFPLSSMAEQAAIEEFMRDLQATLHDTLATNDLEAHYAVFDAMVVGCTSYFGRPRTDSGDAAVDVVLVSRLLPTLMTYAALLSQRIQPTQPACPQTRRFSGVLACVSCIVAHCGGQMAVLGVVPQDALLGFTRALGQFAVSAVYDPASAHHRQLSWHVCWHAVLSLWCGIASLPGPLSAKASGWLASLKATLESTPRFATALGAFPGVHGADRQALLVWEVEEVEVVSRLAAALAVQDVLLPNFVPCAQAGFLFLQQSRLQQHCVASQPTLEASSSEGRRIATAQAHAQRNILTVLLKQPYYAFPRDAASVAAFVFAPELLQGGSPPPSKLADTSRSPAVVDSAPLVLSLDLLRQFTVRELQLLRRLTTSAASTGQDRSPDVSRTSTGSMASRESSVTRSPSRGPLADAETVTDVDELLAAADGGADDGVDPQAIHLETVQLALTAYVLTVEDLVANVGHAPGGLYTPPAVQRIRHTTERLRHTLRSLAREVRDLRRPLLSQIIQAKTAQLDSVLERL